MKRAPDSLLAIIIIWAPGRPSHGGRRIAPQLPPASPLNVANNPIGFFCISNKNIQRHGLVVIVAPGFKLKEISGSETSPLSIMLIYSERLIGIL